MAHVKVWSAADIKPALRITYPNGNTATIFQAGRRETDNIDQFIVTGPAVHGYFWPEVMNAAQMAMYLTKEKCT